LDSILITVHITAANEGVTGKLMMPFHIYAVRIHVTNGKVKYAKSIVGLL